MKPFLRNIRTLRIFQGITRLLSPMVFLCAGACQTSPPPQVIYEPTSSVAERVSGSQRFLPAPQPLPEPSPTPQALTPWTDTRAQVYRAFDAMRAGKVTEAHRMAQALWISFQKKQEGTLDEELSQSPQREVALILAWTHLQSQSYLEGRGFLERLIAVDSQWEPPWHILRDHYLSLRAYHLAERIAETALDRHSEPSALLFAGLVETAFHRKDWAKASRTVERGLRAHPQSALLLAWRGILEREQGFVTEGCEHLALAYEREKSEASLAYNYALCLMNGRHWEMTHTVLQLALAASPRHAPLHYLRGLVFYRQGLLLEARQSWQEFLTLDPTSPDKKFLSLLL